jgi:origin recognition complex subunit 5
VEAIQILLNDPPPLLPDPTPSTIDIDRLRHIYNQFATVVYDTLIAPTTVSLSKYRETCSLLWPRFIWPLVSGDKLPGHAEWDFARLLSKNRPLFQSAGEEALQDRLIRTSNQPTTFGELIAQKKKQDDDDNTSSEQPQETKREAPPLLKYLTTILLVSCYLASHTHPKHDIVLFSRLSTASSTNRRKKKYLARSRAGGITKTPTKSTPTKRKKNLSANDNDTDSPLPPETSTKSKTAPETPKKERADRSMRAIFEKTSNIARSFVLERVIAILRAIHPDGIKMGKGIADRVYVELGELERLRLVVRNEGGKTAGRKIDPGDVMEEKWKCTVGREWVVEMGRRWGVGLEGWEVE